jgi:hypothetical protein
LGCASSLKIGAIVTTSKKQGWLKGDSYVNKVVVIMMDSGVSISEVSNFMIFFLVLNE